MRRLGLAAPVALALSGACSSSEDLAAIPDDALSDAPLAVTRRFPTEAMPGVRFRGCIYASPQGIDDAGGRRVLVVDGGGEVSALDAKTGAKAWSLVLPAPAGEEAMAVSTPAIVGRKVVVAYHTTNAGEPHHVAKRRFRHRAVVVDLDTHALDPAYPVVDIAPTASGRFGPVTLRPSHVMGRGALVERSGRVYVTFGQVRNVQPYHGWIVELDLEAWRSKGAAGAISAARVTTEDFECGEEGADGSRDTKCGGGVWAPSGPLVVDDGASYSLFVPIGNGQLDLARGDYASTILRLGPGLTLDPACDAALCRDFGMDNLASGCADSCKNVFIPRLLPGETMQRPVPDVCEGKSVYRCWAVQDHPDGGSTPVKIALPSGRHVLAYPTKEGHLWLVDADHLGRVYAHYKLAELCGAPGDPCEFDWAGMIVTKPVVTTIGGDAAVIVPTFMGDKTHSSGVVATRVVERDGAPRFEPAWHFPPVNDPSSRERFRRHPSRAVLATPAGAEEHVLVVEAAKPGRTGRLYAIRSRDGKLAAEATLLGPGYRFHQPLFEDGAVFVSSCDSDQGEGWIEAYDLRKP